MIQIERRPRAIVLAHGLWNRGFEAWLLRRRLSSRCGVPAEQFRYKTVTREFDDNLDALVGSLRQREDGPLGLVGHSLGGLLVLAALHRLEPGRVSRAVLLGPPVEGSRAVRRLVEIGTPADWLVGASGAVLVSGLDCGVPEHVEVGVIAGTKGMGMGRVITRFEGPSDGTVAVAETRLEGATARCELEVSHTGLLFSSEVAERTVRFLLTGYFEGEAPTRAVQPSPAGDSAGDEGRNS